MDKKIAALGGIPLVLAVVLAFLLAQSNQKLESKASESDQTAKALEALQAAHGELEKEHGELKGKYQALAMEHEELLQAYAVFEEAMDSLGGDSLLDPFELQQIKRAGIQDVDQLVQDLKDHPEVIGMEAVLGGTMFFTKIVVLNDKWVFGAFEDGHVMGYGIYTWTADGASAITWEELFRQEL
ncbi:hypothetical protein [Anaerotalea alkaliphila]|uniref:Uncharacterized protein n=1 Tax=Anaerotalea alkaliphila TaxID=2662126 RepID=A0A7X5HVG9_9FIRM|nr:hypothetical protein [Anaerotalea alkaliphila]NDL67405.1 hypothetical protein [Anaerotalea alkaliphila]